LSCLPGASPGLSALGGLVQPLALLRLRRNLALAKLAGLCNF